MIIIRKQLHQWLNFSILIVLVGYTFQSNAFVQKGAHSARNFTVQSPSNAKTAISLSSSSDSNNSNYSRKIPQKSPTFFRRKRNDTGIKMVSQVTTHSRPMEDRRTKNNKHDQDVLQKTSIPFRQGIDVFIDLVRSRIADTHEGVSTVQPLHREKEQEVTLVDISWLKTHEEVIVDRVNNLKDAIKEWNEYRMPLLVDRKSGAILDGHHRYHVGRQLGLSRLPVVLVDYLDDDSIDVDVWPECGLDCLSKEDVIEMSLSNDVFPPKTSKHGFVNEMSPINIPLAQLI